MTCLILLLSLSSAVLLQAFAQSSKHLQPDCFPIPTLPHDFSMKPDHWPHSTPLLQPYNRTSTHSVARRQASTYWSGWENIHYWFPFGDSYTSTNFSIHGTQPAISNPLGNPPYPGATSADGPNYVDFLTRTYNQSYIQTYNFGYGGSTIDPALVQSGFGATVQSFEQQVNDEFLPNYVNNLDVPWASSNTLFSVFFGINDVTNTLTVGDLSNDTLNYDLIKAYESLVNQLYAAGARNFLFFKVPPMDRSPGTLELSAERQAAEADFIGAFNFRLGALVYNLALRHTDTTSFIFDTNFLFTEVLDNPGSFEETAAYGNTTDYCTTYENGTPTLTYFDPSCGVPVNEYFWLNNLHPTYPMHNFMASQIIQLLNILS